MDLPKNSWKLAPELEKLQDDIRALMREEVLPAEERVDYDSYALLPEDRERLQQKARQLGIWAVASPRKYGGSEFPVLAQCIVSEEAAKCRMGAYIPAGEAFGWDPPNVIYGGTEEQIQKYAVPTVARGERTFVAITEPGGGADPARAVATTARRDGNEWVLNGEKIYITSAQESRWGVTFARTGEGKSRSALTCFVIETALPGIRIDEVPVIRPYYPTHITFSDYRIPLDNVLGDEGRGFEFVNKWLVHGRVPYAAGTVGIAQAALEIAIDHARNRYAFGGRLADKQALQWMIVDSEIEIRCARALIYQAAWKADSGEEFRNESSIAKVYSTEMAGRVVDRCIQILGARGVTRKLPLERWYRELRIKRIGEGPSEVHRMVVARNMLGTPPKDSATADAVRKPEAV